jgi:hypothetical protein
MLGTAVKILTGAIDALEDIEAEKVVGGEGHEEAIRAIESVVLSTVSDDGVGLAWKTRRLVRAIVNEWSPEEIGPICASVLAELRVVAADVRA